jgi:hypothetical protein
MSVNKSNGPSSTSNILVKHIKFEEDYAPGQTIFERSIEISPNDQDRLVNRGLNVEQLGEYSLKMNKNADLMIESYKKDDYMNYTM